MRKTCGMMLGFLLTVALLTYGCADAWNKVNTQDRITKYIIISQSGGKIMDVWKLKNTSVSPHTFGWTFKEEDNSIIISGNIKVIRVNDENNELWEQYHEYHMEFETKTYRELYNTIIKF